jgi:hypothetical protein
VAFSEEELQSLRDAILDPATTPEQFDEYKRRLEVLEKEQL